MIRSELIKTIVAENPGLRPAEVERILSVILDGIVEQLAQGGRVELRGFGTFSSRSRGSREGRNPRTGEAVAVEPKNVLHFKPGKEMRSRLNADEAD